MCNKPLLKEANYSKPQPPMKSAATCLKYILELLMEN